MQKKPKGSGLRKVGKIGAFLVVAELALAAGSYGVWQNLNQSRESRWKMLNRCPTILNYYYTTGEYLQGDCQQRAQDYEVWKYQHKWTPESK